MIKGFQLKKVINFWYQKILKQNTFTSELNFMDFLRKSFNCTILSSVWKGFIIQSWQKQYKYGNLCRYSLYTVGNEVENQSSERPVRSENFEVYI